MTKVIQGLKSANRCRKEKCQVLW